MGEPVETLSLLCNVQIRCSECCHGDDGLLRGNGTHSIKVTLPVTAQSILGVCVFPNTFAGYSCKWK